MKQIICILALLLMSVTTTKAQTSPATPSIRGKILTEEKQPIEFANIALLSEIPPSYKEHVAEATVVLNFSLPLPETIYYKFLRSVTNPFASLAPPGVPTTGYCKPMPVLLAETVITAARPVFRLKGGKLETSVRQTLLASLNDANDVLKHIPGLRSSDEGYTVFWQRDTGHLYR